MHFFVNEYICKPQSGFFYCFWGSGVVLSAHFTSYFSMTLSGKKTSANIFKTFFAFVIWSIRTFKPTDLWDRALASFLNPIIIGDFHFCVCMYLIIWLWIWHRQNVFLMALQFPLDSLMSHKEVLRWFTIKFIHRCQCCELLQVNFWTQRRW